MREGVLIGMGEFPLQFGVELAFVNTEDDIGHGLRLVETLGNLEQLLRRTRGMNKAFVVKGFTLVGVYVGLLVPVIGR